MIWRMAVLIKPFTFRSHLDHVWDGDTIWLNIERGERWDSTGKYRLYGVDTPEIRGATDEEEQYGDEAKEYVADLLLLQSELVVSTHKGKSKYDWMAEIFVKFEGREYEEGYYDSLSELIILHGHGVPYFGGKKLPWPERKKIQDAARAALVA
jgi:micrococcal nuclease